MSEIAKYTETLTPTQRKVMEALHREIVTLPGIEMKERYKLPFYYGRSWICYLNPVKNEGVELAFIRGNELSNAHGILEHRGRKQIAGIICRQLEVMHVELIRDTLLEAIIQDREVPYRHLWKKK